MHPEAINKSNSRKVSPSIVLANIAAAAAAHGYKANTILTGHGANIRFAAGGRCDAKLDLIFKQQHLLADLVGPFDHTSLHASYDQEADLALLMLSFHRSLHWEGCPTGYCLAVETA